MPRDLVWIFNCTEIGINLEFGTVGTKLASTGTSVLEGPAEQDHATVANSGLARRSGDIRMRVSADLRSGHAQARGWRARKLGHLHSRGRSARRPLQEARPHARAPLYARRR